MKLNVGCGPHYANGWVNLDLKDAPYQYDRDGSLLDLPPDLVDLEAVYLGHVLEHIPLDRLPHALTELRDRMRPGAPLAVVGPDVVKADDMRNRGLITAEVANMCHKGPNHIVGAREGGPHLWDCEEKLVVNLLSIAGFSGIRPVNLANINYAGDDAHLLSEFPVVSHVHWQCVVLAAAPPAPSPKMATPPTR